MPDLPHEVVQDLTNRTKHFLNAIGGYQNLKFVASGGSAAVFDVTRGGNRSAFKAFNPDFFEGDSGDAERRRLDVQKRLIGHSCPSLIQTYQVQEAEGTAFVEMEYVEWPQLAKVLGKVPDDKVISLISQLVDAVRFLDTLNIVHRDIKPENIHVSPDFKQLKLLDLGVAREFDAPDNSEASITDHGNQRPFLATAQYSSPEYLFRLDEPTSKLWKGLNIYQVGAVLHDLIKKEPLFRHEISLGNRWLVARAVLTKPPTFADSVPDRLLGLKGLASRCLIKDLDTRLQLVTWEDFLLEGSSDAVGALRGRLAKGSVSSRRGLAESSVALLEFERNEFLKRFSDRIRGELIHICGAQLPLTMSSPTPGNTPEILYELAVDSQLFIICVLRLSWLTGVYERNVNISAGAQIRTGGNVVYPEFSCHIVGQAVIQDAEDEAVTLVINDLARIIGHALDRIEAEVELGQLNGLNLQESQVNTKFKQRNINYE